MHPRTRSCHGLATRLGIGAALLLAACGGGKDGTGPDGGDADFSATVDGTSWTSAAAATQATGNAGGIFTLVGSSLGSPATVIAITLYNIDTPGTYPLGVTGTVAGGTAFVTVGSATQTTPLSGSAGTVTITAVSATHITGTFSFVAGSRSITQGAFDLPVTTNGGSIAVPPYAASRFGGTLGGAPWNAATVVMVSPPSSGTLAVGMSNDAYQINAIISGWTGAGVYALNSGVSRQFSVIRTGTTQSWGGSGPLSSGTLTVTTATATRIAGTYDITLMPSTGGASGNLPLAGAFDIGIAP